MLAKQREQISNFVVAGKLEVIFIILTSLSPSSDCISAFLNKDDNINPYCNALPRICIAICRDDNALEYAKCLAIQFSLMIFLSFEYRNC